MRHPWLMASDAYSFECRRVKAPARDVTVFVGAWIGRGSYFWVGVTSFVGKGYL